MATLLRCEINDADWSEHIRSTCPLTVRLVHNTIVHIVLERSMGRSVYKEKVIKFLLNSFEMQELGKAVDEYRRQQFIEKRKAAMLKVLGGSNADA